MTRLRVLTLIEARVLTSPAKIVLRFAAGTRGFVHQTFVSFERQPAPGAFAQSALANQFTVEVLRESGRFDLGVLGQLKSVLDKHRPEVVQTHSLKSHLLLSLIRRRPFSWIAFHHGYTAEDLKMRVYNQFDRFSLKTCDRVVTPCSAFAEDLMRKGISGKTIDIVPNAIPDDFLKRKLASRELLRESFGLSPRELIVLAVGRLSPEKGHTYLLEAAAYAKSLAPHLPFKVLIAGDGPLREKLARSIRSAALEDTVKLLGYQSEVKNFYSMADVLALPSLSEGSPMALLESMASRLPVIATRAGGIPEMLVDGESGRLVPVADPKAMAHAMVELLSDRAYARRLAESAFDLICQRFTPAKYNEKVLAICEAASKARQVRSHAA